MSYSNMKSARAFQTTSSSVEKELAGLLKDEVFVDFFNTFLNLPVFGQTPLYYLSENKWYMCPEIPQNKEARRGGYRKWLTGNRFVFFKHTDLYYYYILCKELLRFTSHSKEVLKWTIADDWLLKRSLGSVRGMKRFYAFVKGTQGEELVLFWVRVGRLLQNDERDLAQRRWPLVLFTLIKTIHLREGSSLMKTCHVTPDILLKIFSDSHFEDKQIQVLHQMKFKVLSKLQRYWLPRFLYCCKVSIARVGQCASIGKEYQHLASQPAAVEAPTLLDPESWNLGSAPSGDGKTVTRPYSSRSTKRLLWRNRPRTAKRSRVARKQCAQRVFHWLPMEGERDQRGCTNIVHCVRKSGSGRRSKKTSPFWKIPSSTSDQSLGSLPALFPSNSTSGLDQTPPESIPPHICLNTPACYLPSIVTLGPPPPPALSMYGAPYRDEFLCSALSADTLAGRPYETFLQARALNVLLHHLALWQDLDSLLNVLLKTEEGHSVALRRLIGKKIMADYFDSGSANSDKCITGLTKNTARSLQNALISGDVIPWICAAKHEICPVLAPTFNAFLKEDDRQLLLHLFGQLDTQSKVVCGPVPPSSGPNGQEQQLRRMREAMSLSQACCVYGDTEVLTSETWALMAVEDVTRGGSVNLHFKQTNLSDLPFEILVQKYPKIAVEKMSKAHRLHYNHKSGQEETELATGTHQRKTFRLIKKKPSFSNRCHRRPRSLEEVIRNPSSLVFFKRYLEAYDAHGPLVFYQDVEQLRKVDQPYLLKTKINNIVARFFFLPDAEDYLQCSASLISQIPKMKHVSSDIIFTVQSLVIRSLEENWFKKYQDTFPSPTSGHSQGIVITNKLKRIWTVFTKFIKSVVQFRKAMRLIDTRSKFEAYLRYSWADFSNNCVPTLGGNTEPAGLSSENGYSFCLKKRVVNNKLVTVNFLVNDLSFYLDTESFRNMAGRGAVKSSAGISGEITLLHEKAEMIMNLFLNCDIAPKLRINIDESTRDSVQRSFISGHVDYGLFHKAVMVVFPNLVFCWRKFCSQKAKKEVEDRAALMDSMVSLPNYLHPLSQGSNWYHKIQTTMSMTDDFTTLRFTVHRGLSLLLPRRLDFKVCSGALGPSKPRPSSGLTTVLSDFQPLEPISQHRGSKPSRGPFLSASTSLPHSELSQSSSGSFLPKIQEEKT